jgi:hypothetical protein
MMRALKRVVRDVVYIAGWVRFAVAGVWRP